MSSSSPLLAEAKISQSVRSDWRGDGLDDAAHCPSFDSSALTGGRMSLNSSWISG